MLMRIIAAFIAILTAGPALGADSDGQYEFVKQCQFQSAVLGDFDIVVMERKSTTTRLLLVTSSAQPWPVAYPGLDSRIRPDRETGEPIREVEIRYGVGAMTRLRLETDPSAPGWARLDVGYRIGTCDREINSCEMHEETETTTTLNCILPVQGEEFPLTTPLIGT